MGKDYGPIKIATKGTKTSGKTPFGSYGVQLMPGIKKSQIARPLLIS